MAFLVGIQNSGTGSGFFGFGSGNANVTGLAALAEGRATTLNTNITNFGPNNAIQVVIYRQAGGIGSYDLFATVEVPNGPAPQSTPLATPLDIVSTSDNYNVLLLGDVTGVGGSSDFFNAAVGAVANETGGFAASYNAAPSTLGTVTGEADGPIFWNLDGDLASSANLGVRETFYDPQTNNVVADGDYSVWVLDQSMSILVAEQTVTSSAGVLEVSGQGMPVENTIVYLAVRAASESDSNVAVTVVPATVLDLDAP